MLVVQVLLPLLPLYLVALPGGYAQDDSSMWLYPPALKNDSIDLSFSSTGFAVGETIQLTWRLVDEGSRWWDGFFVKAHRNNKHTSIDSKNNIYAYYEPAENLSHHFNWTITSEEFFIDSESGSIFWLWLCPWRVDTLEFCGPNTMATQFFNITGATNSNSTTSYPASASPPASSSTAALSPTPVTTTSTQTYPAATTAEPQAAAPSGLHPGAKAGVGIGVATSAVAALVGGILWRKRKKRSNSQPETRAETLPETELDPSELPGSSDMKWELPSTSKPSELLGSLDQKWELPGSPGQEEVVPTSQLWPAELVGSGSPGGVGSDGTLPTLVESVRQ